MNKTLFLSLTICMTFFGCSLFDFDPFDQVELDGNVYVYQALVTDTGQGKSYTIEGELTLHESYSEIEILSYDGYKWNLKIRTANTSQGVTYFYIDLQNITRNNETFIVRGIVHDPAVGNYNGFYTSGSNGRMEFSYVSTQSGKNINVTVTAGVKE